LLFAPRDAQSLADSIEKFYHSKTLRATPGENVLSAVLKAFAVETHVKCIQIIYQQLLEQAR
jgi:hypothetical protein